MKIRIGFEMLYDFPQPTPMIMVLGTHFTSASDIIVPCTELSGAMCQKRLVYTANSVFVRRYRSVANRRAADFRSAVSRPSSNWS
jgi:hypothetical protein